MAGARYRLSRFWCVATIVFVACLVSDAQANEAFPLHAAEDYTLDCSPAAYGKALCDNNRLNAELRCLAQGVYFEARGEPKKGQQAVAKAILNRAASARYPNTICKVVYQGSGGRGCQFSWTCKGTVRAPRERDAWHRSVHIAASVLEDPTIAPLGFDAVSFHTTRVNPRWRMRRVAQIGVHIFYAH